MSKSTFKILNQILPIAFRFKINPLWKRVESLIKKLNTKQWKPRLHKERLKKRQKEKLKKQMRKHGKRKKK